MYFDVANVTIFSLTNLIFTQKPLNSIFIDINNVTQTMLLSNISVHGS